MTRNKTALINRLDNALRELYHNATPHHPYKLIPDKLHDRYWDWFNSAAGFELDYIKDNLGCTEEEYKKAKKKGWPCLKERHFYLVSRITEYGKLYSWGRGGRTIAPDGLVNERGGSSFGIKNADNFEEYSNESLTDMIQVIEAFNQYVAQWNSRENLSSMWQEEAKEKLYELSGEAKTIRKSLKQLAIEARALAGIAGTNACNTLKDAIKRQKQQHKDIIEQVVLWKEAAKEGI
jgi:hypothetical protein